MFWWSNRKGNPPGSRVVPLAFLEHLWYDVPGFKPPIDAGDGNFLLTKERDIRALREKYWDPTILKYHGNSPDFPDCTTFTKSWVGRLQEGAHKEGWTHAPIAGYLSLIHQVKGQHGMGWTAWVPDSGPVVLKLDETQRTTTPYESIGECKTVIKVRA